MKHKYHNKKHTYLKTLYNFQAYLNHTLSYYMQLQIMTKDKPLQSEC